MRDLTKMGDYSITDVGLGNMAFNASHPAYVSKFPLINTSGLWAAINNATESGGGGANTTADIVLCNKSVVTSGVNRTFRMTVDIFIVGVMVVFGLIGNALSIAVLRRDRDKKNTTNWLLATLALADCLYLIACLFFQLIKAVNDITDWVPGLSRVFPYMEAYIWAFASITQTITVWLVMLVTVDRYIAVCKPLKTQLRTIQRAKMAVGVVIIAGILYNVPRFLERKIVETTDPCTGLKVVKSQRTALRGNWLYFLIYKTIMYFVFRAIGPLITLICLNLRLIKALQEVRRKHRDLTKSSKHRENITLMLVVVVSVFIICEIPDLTLRIVFALNKVLKPNITVLRYFNCITNALLTVNSSTNFLVYCLIGHKFRKILRQMCCARLKHGGAIEVSETEPLNTRVTHLPTTSAGGSKNGVQRNGPHVVRNGGKTELARDGDIAL